MPLVSSKPILEEALRRHFAVGAFNANNMEQVQAIVEVAEEERAPVILQVSQGAIRYAGIEFAAALRTHLFVVHGHSPLLQLLMRVTMRAVVAPHSPSSTTEANGHKRYTNGVARYARPFVWQRALTVEKPVAGRSPAPHKRQLPRPRVVRASRCLSL